MDLHNFFVDPNTNLVTKMFQDGTMTITNLYHPEIIVDSSILDQYFISARPYFSLKGGATVTLAPLASQVTPAPTTHMMPATSLPSLANHVAQYYYNNTTPQDPQAGQYYNNTNESTNKRKRPKTPCQRPNMKKIKSVNNGGNGFGKRATVAENGYSRGSGDGKRVADAGFYNAYAGPVANAYAQVSPSASLTTTGLVDASIPAVAGGYSGAVSSTAKSAAVGGRARVGAIGQAIHGTETNLCPLCTWDQPKKNKDRDLYDHLGRIYLA